MRGVEVQDPARISYFKLTHYPALPNVVGGPRPALQVGTAAPTGSAPAPHPHRRPRPASHPHRQPRPPVGPGAPGRRR